MTYSNLAALRGEPSYVWRSGQERRLQMILKWAALENAVILEAGTGVGMYASQFRRRFSAHVEAFDVEADRIAEARIDTPHALVAAAEALPYADNTFDTILSNEVLEHVLDDGQAAHEMIRVLKPGGRAVIFAPNHWYPFETHGYYWNGTYHFGNIPLINYLPDAWRNKLAPHVRAYTARNITRLFDGAPARIVHHSRIYGGYDNIARKFGNAGKIMRRLLYRFENTPLDTFGLSHLLVVEKRASE